MNDNVQEGLFESEMKEDQPMQLKTIHRCAKCGTGYAGPECKVNGVGPNASRFTAGDGSPADQEARDLKIGPYDPANAEIVALGTIKLLLRDIIGEDITREGLRETPARVVKAWKHWTSGYHVNIPGLLKVFEDGAEGYDEMVVRKGIRIYSHCEHHLAPIIGECTIAYIPGGRVVGLSKLDRLADAFSRRLQVQERLTSQIADALMEHLNPLGVGVWINARHMCIESRGVSQHNSDTVTTALRGAIKEQPAARAEFLALCRS